MSGHTRWEPVAPLPDRAGLEIQLAYVDGYILALEDVFKDLAQILFPLGPDGSHEQLRAYRKEVRRTLSISMESARRTRKKLQDQYEGKTDDPTTEASPGEDIRGDLG